ncbi:benzoate carboxyl methyltransferase [Fusarium denticulatum]|uniref:Benzoate carboxyl methyltransferase n=1 Tax=Fusarium denticulatum TaxID=48507 RepID=A0A8H5XIE2_9HYPO|nr:benzoate carboxyl methyltransferase [Fusarium denticulatum]
MWRAEAESGIADRPFQELPLLLHDFTVMKADNVSMQGGGYYNENSTLQGQAIEKCLELLGPSVHQSPSITLADYGSSEGKNSVRLFSQYLKRFPYVTSATLIFNDTPSNDFSSLTSTVHQNWDTLSQDGSISINTLLSPRSYFEQVLPDGFVDAGFNFTALNWLRNMPDASSIPLSLSAAAHVDFVNFLLVRHKEVRQHGTMTICVPSDGDISVLPTFRCFETSLRILYDKYRVDPTIARRLPMYFRTLDEILKSITAVDTKWNLKTHHTLPLMHKSWSPEVIEAGSEEARMSARKRYTDAVAGFALAACSQFFIDGLKHQGHCGSRPEEEAINLREEFMADLTTHTPPPTRKYLDGDESWALLGMFTKTLIAMLSTFLKSINCNILPDQNLPIMAELGTDLYRPDPMDDNGQNGALVKALSPTDDVVNEHPAEMRFLGKKLNKKKKKSGKEKRLVSEPQPIELPPLECQETTFADESLAAEPVTMAKDEELSFDIPEAIPDDTTPVEDIVPEVQSAHEPLAESPVPDHINGGTETDVLPPAHEAQELIYLPFSAQHKLMMHLQERLETMSFSFAQRALPHALENRGWDCPEMLQLHLWMKDSVFQQYVEQNVPDMERCGQLLSSVSDIRRCAVNRRRIDTTALETLLSSALELAKVLEEQPSVNELEQLRESVIQTTHRLAEETQVIQARYETKLQEITAARARLDVMEEKTKVLLSRRLEKSRSTANGRIIMLIREAECSTPKVALPGGSTTRSCLDWMNDLESSLALGEDDHEDFVG